MIHIALVGCAHIHTPGFIKKLKERTADLAVKYVWDHDPARARKRADELSSSTTADLSVIWNDPLISAVVICSETNRHEELVLPAAAAGKHLFVEKPLGMGRADSNRMAQAIEKAGVIFQTGYFMRGNPAILFLKQQIDAGLFGKITRIRGSNCHGGSLNGWFDTEWRWMADPAIAGCGAFGDLGTHSLDLMLWLAGDVTGVAAQLDRGTARYDNCDETGEALMRFKNGAIGTLAGGWVDVANPVSLLISGTEAHAAIINGQLFLTTIKLEGADGKQPWTDLPPALPHAFDLFLDAVCGKTGLPLVGVHEAARRSTVMEAMYKSATGGGWIGI